MKRKFLILAAFSIFLNYTSCKNYKVEASIISIIPTNTGNTWTYVDSIFNTGISVDTSISKVGDSVNINGKKGFNIYPTYNPHNISFIFCNDKEGNYLILGGYSDRDSLFITSIKFKRNAKKGETWYFNNISIKIRSTI